MIQVGIIPTDSFPALVCDLECRPAVQLLYELKGASPSKKLSILCRNFQDVSTYTLGFPVATAPGRPNFYKIAKAILPGPYTLILSASKSLPKQITNFESGSSKKRSTVGVRLPDDPVCQEVLARLERPLLCTTATVDEALRGGDGSWAADAAVLADVYGPRGLGFVVDSGPRRVEPSSVVDLTGPEPVVVRQGKGDTSWMDQF